MTKLLIHLRAANLLMHRGHNYVKGGNFQSDHEMLGDICDKSEVIQYKLKQRLKSGV